MPPILSRLILLGFLSAAALVPAFDYTIGRVDSAIQAGRFAGFEAIWQGTAPSPHRYRVLSAVSRGAAGGAGSERVAPPDRVSSRP